MVYNPNIPQANDFQDVSQGDILANFMQLDTSFDVDHYKFSDLTTDNGKHKQVTAVSQTSHPTTGSGETKIYAYKESVAPLTNLGPMIYARGESNSYQTPISPLQSPSGGTAIGTSTTVDIFNFSNMTNVYAMLYVMDITAIRRMITYVYTANGLLIGKDNLLPNTSLTPLETMVNDNVIQIRNTSPTIAYTIFWTLDFKRIG